jgi:hypothetical protein
VKPSDAVKWFSVVPEQAANVLPMALPLSLSR